MDEGSAIDPSSFATMVKSQLADIHSPSGLKMLSEIIITLPSKEDRMELLRLVAVATPTTWEEVAESVWPADEIRERNRFPFLQGDLIRTSRVKRWGVARSAGVVDTWVVLNSTCDIIRSVRSGSHVRVVPAFPVMKLDKKFRDKAQKDIHDLLRLSSELRYKRGFPFPRSPDDDQSILGYFCDLEEVAALEAHDFAYATVLASLTEVGWHLLAACLRRIEVEANAEDDIAIRNEKATKFPS